VLLLAFEKQHLEPAPARADSAAAIHNPDANRSERLLLLIDHLGVAPEAVKASALWKLRNAFGES
jgi:hypothetical protein